VGQDRGKCWADVGPSSCYRPGGLHYTQGYTVEGQASSKQPRIYDVQKRLERTWLEPHHSNESNLARSPPKSTALLRGEHSVGSCHRVSPSHAAPYLTSHCRPFLILGLGTSPRTECGAKTSTPPWQNRLKQTPRVSSSAACDVRSDGSAWCRKKEEGRGWGPNIARSSRPPADPLCRDMS
jgi:hypothetical protein